MGADPIGRRTENIRCYHASLLNIAYREMVMDGVKAGVAGCWRPVSAHWP